MRQSILIVFIFALLAGGTFIIVTMPRPLDASVLPDHEPDIENGRTMFWVGGCASCHAAPGAEGEERLKLAGGVELNTPFGVIRAPNLSPEPRAGIGAWSTIDFVNAMVRGLSPDGRHSYPAFPYPNYNFMRYEDVIDLKAFLDTLPKVAGTVDSHNLAFPFNIRRGLGLWKLRYLDGQRVEPDSATLPLVERGRYLVEGPGHCGACHTPRDRFGGVLPDRHLAGALLFDADKEDGKAPNLTPHEDGLGDWSERDIAYSLETGFTPDFDTFGGSMVEVQSNLAAIPAEERAAIAAYLKSIPALPSATE